MAEDAVSNDFGDILLNLCACCDLSILNGLCNPDQSGKFTYISPHGNSTVDYCITSHSLAHIVLNLNVRNRIESTHMPVEFDIN